MCNKPPPPWLSMCLNCGNEQFNYAQFGLCVTCYAKKEIYEMRKVYDVLSRYYRTEYREHPGVTVPPDSHALAICIANIGLSETTERLQTTKAVVKSWYENRPPPSVRSRLLYLRALVLHDKRANRAQNAKIKFRELPPRETWVSDSRQLFLNPNSHRRSVAGAS